MKGSRTRSFIMMYLLKTQERRVESVQLIYRVSIKKPTVTIPVERHNLLRGNAHSCLHCSLLRVSHPRARFYNKIRLF